jgi:hypothetical protein
VKPIFQSCRPRHDLLTGSFNPEIFTAVLSQVLEFYRGSTSVMRNIYTDANAFFTEATYPTDGMKTVLAEVFGRLSGDNTIAAIHRLETAFGGGKTHTLIACTHLAHRGTELASVTGDLLDPGLLPEPGTVAVVGVAGDDVPVHKPKGKDLVPYTLWGEIAFQVGGRKLYGEVEAEATSHAAPGKNYFEKVLGGRRVLIMLDELAQYATRLEAARENGAEQLAAFLMGLHGYARSHSGISIVLTLASQRDAFAAQTQRLTELLANVRGKEVSEDEAVALQEKAEKDLQSVVARDASSVTPVQAAEISRVLAKRLFQDIDKTAAQQTATAFCEMYAKSAALLPDDATRADFKDKLVAHYPFHPTLINYLNRKLATVETFQGTRGVLRVLAVTVRSIWKDEVPIPLIQTSQLNLRDARIVGEVLGRTGSGDLVPVLNADVGGVDTEQLEGGRSNAELADLRNPHPLGFPMHEWTWRVVFLHSLVGRDLGFSSELFGISEPQALFETAFPGLTPPQVQTALEQIREHAFYLRSTEGRYFASLDPSVNIALARLRRSLEGSEKVTELLDATARKVVKKDLKTFHVEHDVSAPEHISDKKDRPVLALVALDAGTLDVEACITTTGPHRPRIQQNNVFLLVPDTVQIKGYKSGRDTLFSSQQSRTQETMQKLLGTTRWVVAMRQLKENPQRYGINRARMDEQDFDERHAERENALVTAVTQSYASLWYPSASGKTVRKEIKTAGGEGGASTIEQIRQVLLEAGELVTAEHTGQSDLMSLSQMFFGQGDTVALATLRENFHCARHWPVLESPSVFEQIVRSGVAKGAWCLFRMGGDENVKPDEFYSRDTGDLPLDLNLSQTDYLLVTPPGAKQRGWTQTDKVDPGKVKDWVKDAAGQTNVATVEQMAERVAEKFGTVEPQSVQDAVATLVQDGRLIAFRGQPDQEEKPAEMYRGSNAMLFTPAPTDVVVTIAEAARRGWLSAADQVFRLSGKDGANKLLPLLKRLGSLYAKGARSKIELLDLTDLELPDDGRLRIQLSNVSPGTMKLLGELFEVVAGIACAGGGTEGFLEIPTPDDECILVKELKKV